MIKRKFGWTNVGVSIIGQGTRLIEKGSSSDDSYNRAIRTLQMELDLGITHINTAEMYGNGKAEELVGLAIAGRRKKERRDIFLASKSFFQMPLSKVQ